MKLSHPAIAACVTLLIGGCASPGVKLDTERHVTPTPVQSAAPATPSGDIPGLVGGSPSLLPPKAPVRQETYSVVVNRIPVQDLLFALARDAKVNVDIHPGISGTITLNALDQTLPQLLTRISRQADMRFELEGANLVVMPDTPFLRTYKVDYVNMSRETVSTVSVFSQIAAAGSGAQVSGGSVGGQGAGAGNGSTTTVTNAAKNSFWETLVQNLKDLLRETDKVFPEGASERTQETTQQDSTAINAITDRGARKADDIALRAAEVERRTTRVERIATFREAASIIANPETGVISVRATGRQHEKVQEFLSHVMSSARKQVLIEATIAEVDLSQSYQQGVDWSKISLSGYGWRVVQGAAGSISAPGASIFEIGYDSQGGGFSGAVKLLESFGSVKVLSSPKLSVLNNQTAVLKVVDNVVYFTIESQTNQNQNQTLVTYTSTAHTIPIGLVINVTPQIGDGNTVLLNLRPSLSRTVGEGALDPNPILKQENIENRIPIVRSREIESVLRVSSGNVAVMGGLMEDMLDNTRDTTPGLSSLPVLGNLFQNKNDNKRKTELIIFVRPTIIQSPSLEADYKGFRNRVPGSDFFDNNPGPAWPPGTAGTTGSPS